MNLAAAVMSDRHVDEEGRFLVCLAGMGENIQINIKGRHDPVIVPRAVVVVEAMAALVIADALLMNMGARMDWVEKIYR